MIRTAAALFSAALVLSATAASRAQVQNPHAQSAGIGGMEGMETTTTRDLQQKLGTIMSAQNSCPVSMQARQRGLSQMVRTKRTPPLNSPDAAPRPAQRIHLILKGFAKDKQVASATITARGLSARSRTRNLNLTGNELSDILRTLQVTFTPDENGSVSADIDLPAFTAVNSLQLRSITYSDGSSWTVEKVNACIIQPDPLMLVAGN